MEATPWLPDVPPGEDELPTDDGTPMESSDHRAQMNVLCDTLDLHWRDRTDYYVGGNQPLYFSAAQVLKNEPLCPDVMIILHTVRRPRKSWEAERSRAEALAARLRALGVDPEA